jgi:FkbH-like protein
MSTRELILLGDKTLSGVERALNAALRQQGLAWTARDAGFDSWLREIMDEGSRTRQDTGAALGFLLSPRILETADCGAAHIETLLATLQKSCTGRTVLFSNLYADPLQPQPLVRHSELVAAAAATNQRLYAFAREHGWFHVVDHVSMALRHGAQALTDVRFESTAQMYFSPGGGRLVANVWLRLLRALDKPSAKVMVVDLDNTMWRGILGEDGADGIAMGPSGPGWAHRRLQEALLRLKANGILLAVASKNNPDETLRVLAEHPDCLLRPKDFSAIEINWGAKSESIQRMAAKLNLGIDAFVFLDDSHFEREQVRQALPGVTVLEFPEDPLQLITLLSDSVAFDSPRVTREDRERAASYAAEAQRDELKQQAATPEEFFRSLKLQLKLFSAQPAHVSRLHQLILKTNQFNLTTERTPMDEFRAALEDPDKLVLGMRVADTYGDSGVTGLAIVSGLSGSELVVENFLLSCRVIGRTVENAFLHWLVEQAARQGQSRIRLRFKPTARNQVAGEFLERSGLVRNPAGETWDAEVSPAGSVLAPHYVSVDDSEVQMAEAH